MYSLVADDDCLQKELFTEKVFDIFLSTEKYGLSTDNDCYLDTFLNFWCLEL